MYTPPPPAKQKVALWDALKARDPAAVERALLEGSDPNSGYGTWVPLGWAIRNQQPELALILIGSGANINVIENGHSLFSMALSVDMLKPVVEKMVALGIEPNGHILRTVARKANVPLLEWALDAGVDPNNIEKHRDPALVVWPARIPVPQRLLDATFERPLTQRVAGKIIAMITRRKNMALLTIFMCRAQVSEDTKRALLQSAIYAKWRRGVDTLLDAHYCDPRQQDPQRQSPIAECAGWISDARHRKNGFVLLDRLFSYGYDINSTYLPPATNLETSRAVSNSLWLFKMTDSPGKAELMYFLLDRGLQPYFETACTSDTLAHALIYSNEWDLLDVLVARFPSTQWERPMAPSLVCAWAQYHNPQTRPKDLHVDPELSLARVSSLAGFDPQKRNEVGESGLRVFMKRPSGTGFVRISEILMRAGINPFVKDKDGMDDVAFSKTTRLSIEAQAQFEALALLYHTNAAQGGAQQTARRL